MSRLITFACSLPLLIACHGKSSSTTVANGGGAAPAAPTAEALRHQLETSTATLPVGNGGAMCGGEYPTLAEKFAAEVKMMSETKPAKVDSRCNPGEGGRWQCHTEITEDAPASPDDPCGEGSAYTYDYETDAAGAIDLTTLSCVAAG